MTPSTAHDGPDGYPRRVLHVFPPCGRAGTEAVLRSLISGFQAHGVASEAFFQRDIGGGELFRELCPTHFEAETSLPALLATGRFDAVHAVASSITIGLREAVRSSRFPGPVVVSCHGDYIIGWHRGCASALVALTSFWAERIRPFTDLPIRVIPNPVDTVRFAPAPAPEPGDAGPIVIGWVGRILDPHKNTDLLRGVMAALPAGEYCFWIADTNSDDDPRRVLGDLCSRVERYGHVRPSEMPAFYRGIAARKGLLLFTSVREAFPMAVLESMASGCPVVVPDAWGSREIVEHGVTGLIVPSPMDASSVLECLDELRDGGRWEALSRAGRIRAEERYSLQAVSRAYLDVFASLPEQPVARRPADRLLWLLRSLRMHLRPLPQAVWHYRPRRAVESIDRALRATRAGATRVARDELLDALVTFPPAFLKLWRLKFLLCSVFAPQRLRSSS